MADESNPDSRTEQERAEAGSDGVRSQGRDSATKRDADRSRTGRQQAGSPSCSVVESSAAWPEAWSQKCEECGVQNEDVRRRIPCGSRALCHQCFKEVGK